MPDHTTDLLDGRLAALDEEVSRGK